MIKKKPNKELDGLFFKLEYELKKLSLILYEHFISFFFKLKSINLY